MNNHQKFLFVLLLSVSLLLPSSTKLDSSSSDVPQYTAEMDCLAQNVYYEAGNEPFEGKLAVAQVTINRANHRSFPHNVCDVVYQRTQHKKRWVCQFSWTCGNVNQNRNEYKWQEAKYIATKVLTTGMTNDIIKNTNALYYHANYVNPGWNKHFVVTRIGHHIFYKDI